MQQDAGLPLAQLCAELLVCIVLDSSSATVCCCWCVDSVLQDAGLPLAKLCGAYQQLVCIVRKLYQECRLVHADLSEYNILVHKVSSCKSSPGCVALYGGDIGRTDQDRRGPQSG